MRTEERLIGMSTRTATPASLLPEALTDESFTVSATNLGNLQSGWDLHIPLELLQEILSRLGLKANIQASAVCKTWLEAAVSVRKLQRRPWVFHNWSPGSPCILVDPLQSQSQTYKLHLPELEGYRISCCKDGWVLMSSSNKSLFLNPFTKNRLYLPSRSFFGDYLAFSAAPTSTSCVVISHPYELGDYVSYYIARDVVISTWRPGEAAWTTHRFWSFRSFRSFGHCRRWDRCVFSSGLFYCLSNCGCLGVFDPCEATWNLLPVKQSPAIFQAKFNAPVLMTEHEGDIFVTYVRDKNNPVVFKLNLKQHVWEEKKRDLGGLTLFASWPASFMRAALSADERNRIYPLCIVDIHGIYYSLGDRKSSDPPPRQLCLSSFVAWVEPPDDFNVSLL